MKQITVALAVDDRGGMTFNKRRLSRDKLLYEDLLRCSTRVLALPYSMTVLEGYEGVCFSDEPFSEAEDKDTVFVESPPIAPYLGNVARLIVYKWNRTYPFDKKLDIDPLKSGFKLKEVTEFVGSSHEKITKEIYER